MNTTASTDSVKLLERIPHTFIALVARFSIAAVFWNSGQTKVEGLVINFVSGEFRLGWPRLSDSAIALFKDEYKLPLIPPELAAPMAAAAEHVFPLLILAGLATRFSALALLVMTLVIQVFVYPGAYATHATWAAVLLYLMARGPGLFSIDHWLAARQASSK
jgi:putative oxidoreductase